MLKGKRYIILLFCAMAVLPAVAQDNPYALEFQDIRKKLIAEFDQFRREANAAYVKALGESWKEYRVYPAKEIPRLPEPVTLPALQPKDAIPGKGAEIFVDTIVPVDSVCMEEADIREQLGTVEREEAVFSFRYYGAPLRFHYQIAPVTLTTAREKEVAGLWKRFSETRFTPLLLDMLNYREQMQMNDWAYYQLVKKISSYFPALQEEGARITFQHFLLVQSGYDARLGLADGRLVLLLAIRENVFAHPYFRIGDTPYYIMSEKKPGVLEKVFSCRLPEKLENGKHLSLLLRQQLLLPPDLLSYRKTAGGIDVRGMVNTNLVEFLADYPSCEYTVYADAAIDGTFYRPLLDALKKALAGKGKKEALDTLLTWLQTGFGYQTDEQQFGREKSFFVEENFFYPSNDCEDRAILFCNLVRSLLDLKVVLLSYPGHVAAAVYLPQATGDFVRVDGEKYLVCDPTCVNAMAGRCMPSYLGKKAKIIRLKESR